MATVLELYEKLKPKLGEREARELLEFIEQSVERRAATKEDLQRVEVSLREDLQRTEVSLREEIAALRAEIQRVLADLLRWSFAFWAGAVGTLSGVILALR